MLRIINPDSMIDLKPFVLEKKQDGLYSIPTMRCGILPYYRLGNQIIWGCVKSDRVGPITIAPPAGIQDILVIKDNQRFSLEVGKRFPDLKYPFLNAFVGKLFRNETYQDIINCLVDNEFELYVENPFLTAIHETLEEHGLDLRNPGGRDYHLLHTLSELPVQYLSGKQGATALSLWVVCLNNIEGIELSDTKKTEEKIKRNMGRDFYEQGCWGMLADFREMLLEARRFPSLSSHTSHQADLIAGVLEAFEETLEFLERTELLIKENLKKSIAPVGSSLFFSKAYQKHEQAIHEILSVKTVLKNISYDTWLVLDLDNTVMESVSEVGSDQWFNHVLDYATKVFFDSNQAMKLSLLIYGAVQAHTRMKAVERPVVKIIKALQDIGIPVIALTARNINIKDHTIRQLNEIGIDFSRHCIEVNDSFYEKGIIFCNGKNKGQMWRRFLEKSSFYPKDIVMLDDKKRHLERMLTVTKTLKVNFTGFRYGALDEKVRAFDMKVANHQLAYLKHYLPIDVQEAITSLQLLPHDIDPVSNDPVCLDGFFNLT